MPCHERCAHSRHRQQRHGTGTGGTGAGTGPAPLCPSLSRLLTCAISSMICFICTGRAPPVARAWAESNAL